jgi:hypothetical protein
LALWANKKQFFFAVLASLATSRFKLLLSSIVIPNEGEESAVEDTAESGDNYGEIPRR